MRITPILVAALLTAACTPSWSGTGSPEPATVVPAATPARAAEDGPNVAVFRSATGQRISFQELVENAAKADVVFFGEQHDDPETHFAEFALLEGLGLDRPSITLSLEMFERDTQGPLTRYLHGYLSETEFLAQSRPWERYVTDYRPMVQLARARGWPVLAANVPRPMASAVSRLGMTVLDTMTLASRGLAARDLVCPHNAYYDRFAVEMTGHSAGGGPPTAADSAQMRQMTDRFYEAQCLKDETMAESISEQFGAVSPETGRVQGFAYHVDGAFHSDYRQGTVERLLRRKPWLRVTVISAIPVEDPRNATLGQNGSKADYVIFTQKAPAKK